MQFKKLTKSIKPPYGPQFYRQFVRIIFLITILIIGLAFTQFVNQLDQGQIPDISRPPGVEAFLPISALISLKYWIITGVINKIHPSGMLIFLFITVSAIIFKKSFCSWICPVGLLNDWLSKIHFRIFKKGLKIHPLIDIPLRSLKYLLAFFFIWAVSFQMDEAVLQNFIYSPYNRIADIKMLKFFTEISSLAFWVIVVLVLLSILIRDFWCRYLCPYGALLGGLSFLSIFKVRRNDDTCTNCKKCDKVCPSKIVVSKVNTVFSDECHACQKCVDICPEKQTLLFTDVKKKFHIKTIYIGVALIFLFAGGAFVANQVGYWENEISKEEYLYHTERMHQFGYGHNRGSVPGYNREQMDAEIEKFKILRQKK